jgi:transcription elongation factor GreA
MHSSNVFQTITMGVFKVEYYFTPRGLEKFKEKLSHLENRLRELQKSTQEVAETGGDLWHDNASYEHLVEDIRLMNTRVSEGYGMLNHAKIVPLPKNPARVCLGSRVRAIVDGEEMTLDIVCHGEADADNDKILYASPIAKALLGHLPGEVYTAKVNNSFRKFNILSVEALNVD